MLNIETNNEQLLKLFHICVEPKFGSIVSADEIMPYGIVFINQKGEVIHEIDKNTRDVAQRLFATTNAMWSNTFHKSLERVAEATIEELIAEQLVHYFSTYGLESFGLKAIPYIPPEALNLNLDASVNKRGFTVIKVVDELTAIQYIDNYFKTTFAPNKMFVEDAIKLLRYTTLEPEEIVSFELKCAQYNRLGLVPADGTTFLRFLIYETTRSTMLIKNCETINRIKGEVMNFPDLYKYFDSANLTKLAEVFYRFKPLFLAFKAYPYCASYINKIRRLAVKYHKPLGDINVQNVSKLFAEDRFDDAIFAIEKASNRQLIKLYNYFKDISSSDDKTTAIYTIRNGKTYFNAEVEPKSRVETKSALAVVWAEICRRFRGTLKGKTFFIPSYINYAVPYTEKQFIGTIPYGTKITCPAEKAFTVAIAWENYKGNRCDIDLHLSGLKGSYGWNSDYRGEDNRILYSGDMTDATNGASEAFYFNPYDDMYIASVNNYTGYDDMPFKFFLTDKEFDHVATGYYHSRPTTPPVDVADAIFAPIDLTFKDTNNMNIGFFNDKHEFVFYGGELGSNIVPNHEMLANALETIASRATNVMSMRELLLMAGANIIDETTENREKINYIDLSPASINFTSLLEIVDQN